MRNTLTVVILLICLKAGIGFLTQKPQDSVAVIGKPAYLNCSTSEPPKRIQWYHYAVGEAQREAIYRCDNFTEYWYPCYRNGRYVVERNLSSGAYNLVIPTVVSSDVGRYLCEVDGDEGLANLTARVDVSPSCDASEICRPYVKPYINAIICIILIIIPAAIVATMVVLWYLRVYKPKKQKQQGSLHNEERETETGVERIEEYSTKAIPVASSKGENEQLMSKATESDHTMKIKQTEKSNKEERLVIKKLTTDLESKSNEAQKYAEKIQEQSNEMDELRKKYMATKDENSQLKTSVKDLERSLYPQGSIEYIEKPSFVHRIITGASIDLHKPINGLTILGKEMFVLHENYSMIEVYESETFKHNWAIYGMSHPMDIASCKSTNCLYVINKEESEPESQILKLEPSGKLIKKWSTGGIRGRLSTCVSNVIVCLYEKQLIHEYNKEGILIQTVRLDPAVGFNHPSHAIKVTSSHFAVCHGDAKDELHRVCIVDSQGNIIRELREWKKKESLNVPICLVEDSERSILVADMDNQKIRLINNLLKPQRNLMRKENELEGFPVRICQDEANGRLFVAANTLGSNKKEYKDGRIISFIVKKLVDW